MRNLVKWVRQPRMISPMWSLHTHGMPVFSTMALPSFGSETPSENLAFLASFTFGRFSSRKFLRSSEHEDSATLLISSSAIAAEVKGLKPFSVTTLPKRVMSLF